MANQLCLITLERQQSLKMKPAESPQRISAYEVIHKNKAGKENKITFLDTPGHEAFCAIRARS